MEKHLIEKNKGKSKQGLLRSVSNSSSVNLISTKEYLKSAQSKYKSIIDSVRFEGR